MKRALGYLLAGLGGFLLVLALALRFWVVPSIAKAPLSPGEDTGGITVTNSEGVASELFNPGALASGGNPVRTDVALKAVRNTKGDVPASQTSEAQDQDLAVYDSFQSLTDSEGTVVNADTLRVAFNRVSSELVNCCGANVNGNDVTFEGINPLKFPMFTKQQDYQYFDTTLGKAWPAVYSGEEDIDGLTTYKFVMTIPPTMTSEMDVPGALVGSTDPTFKAGRFYSNVRTLNVDPTTGSIVKGQEQQKQTLRGPDGTDKVTVISANLAYTDAEVQESVDDAKSKGGLINTLYSTVPLVALVLGALCLIGGILLMRRRDEATA